jgi:hypothetical protein
MDHESADRTNRTPDAADRNDLDFRMSVARPGPAHPFVLGQVRVAKRAEAGAAQLLSVEAVVAGDIDVLVPVRMQP